jgi:hypothetical protein
MEIFEEEGWIDDTPLEDRTDVPMGSTDSRPTQLVDLLIIDRATAEQLARFAAEDGIDQGQVIATALKLYARERDRRKV